MFNEEALEFVVDQNLYYPAATNYGYYCSQFELVADGGRGFCNFSLHINFIHSCQIYGIQGCIALEELYFSHNGITKTEGLSSLVNLQVLDVSSNKLISVDDIPNLTQLDDLWLSDNQIESLKGIVEAVAGSREKLTIIYLENNPCNTKKEKMEMTTPIFTSKNQSDGVKMDMTTAVLTTKGLFLKFLLVNSLVC